MCTTVPPAKSSAPFCHSQPAFAEAEASDAASVIASGPGQNQTMCAIGRYANVNHSTENSSTAENRARSANAPTMRPTVIAANVAWNTMNRYSGITTPLLNVPVVAKEAAPSVIEKMPDRNSRSKPPKNAPPSVNAMLYPYTVHSTTMSEKITNTCISTESMFFERTRPP